MVKVVVLDVDGTLMDTNYLHVEAWARAFDEVGHRAPRVEIHPKIGIGSGLLISEFVDDEETASKVAELHAEHYDELQKRAFPLPGARELIDSLAKQNYGVWLATSAEPHELERSLEMLEAEGKISGIVNSSDVEESKPAPDIFELALEKAGVEPHEAVAVGDAIWDVESAKAAGLRCVAVLTGGAFSKEALKEAGAIAVYRDCIELMESGFPEWVR
ncbi:MAG: HAD family hydrolase [Actinomycetota bacterium]|nr:HAD family hydrolase [Actinomycetota bacterium]